MTIQVRANYDNEPFVLDDSAEVVDAITLAASQGALTIGAVLGEITGTPGIYNLVDKTATDGSQLPKILLATPDVVDVAAITENLSAYLKGLFDENQLVFAAGTTIDDRPGAELMPNQVDRDFSGASAWADVDFASYDETGDLSITSDAADQYCTLAIASFPTVIGQKYRMYYDCAGLTASFVVQDFTGAQELGTINAEVTQGSISWTALTTGGLRIAAVSTVSVADLDNFSLKLDEDFADMSMKDLLRMNGIRLAPGLSVSRYQNPVV